MRLLFEGNIIEMVEGAIDLTVEEETDYRALTSDEERKEFVRKLTNEAIWEAEGDGDKEIMDHAFGWIQDAD